MKNISRKYAQQRALDLIEDIIKREGGNSISFKCPRKGKCYWTNNEVKQAIINDRNLYDGKHEVKNTNPIDDVMRYLRYAEEHNLKF